MDQKIGNYSFIIGVLIAIILGLALPLGDVTTAWLTSILVVLGLIVGFLNVTGKETRDFLIVALILVLVAYAGSAAESLSKVLYIGPYLGGIFKAIMAFVVPATIVVGLKDIWALGKYE